MTSTTPNASSETTIVRPRQQEGKQPQRPNLHSFRLYQKPKSLTPQRCHRIVRYARKRLRGQDNNSADAYDNSLFDTTGRTVLSHSEIELGSLLGKGAFSSVYAIKSISKHKQHELQEEQEQPPNDNDTNIDTERMVVKFLRTKLYDNHGLFAASAADLVKEGNILSTLSHTNVIRLHAVSSLDGVSNYKHGYHDSYFLVLERLECTLTDRIGEWQERHKALYLAAQLDGDCNPIDQFVDRSVSSVELKSTASAPRSTSGWRSKLAVFRSSKHQQQRSSDLAFLEDSSDRTAVAISCDGSSDDNHCETSNDMTAAATTTAEDTQSRAAAGSKRRLLDERIGVTLQLADALAYLHDHNVLHRDLKPDNIGFDTGGVLKVFDFDIARVVPTLSHEDASNIDDSSSVFRSSNARATNSEDAVFCMTQKVGSPRYMSPECARREPYNLKADVYSYAVLAHQILTLQKPYDDISDEDHDELVFYKGVRPHIPLGLPSQTKDLLAKAWSHTVRERPTMETVRTVLAEDRSELLRLGSLERTAPSVPVAHTTAYVWSCSFAAVSDNHKVLRRIRKKNKKKIANGRKSSKSGSSSLASLFFQRNKSNALDKSPGVRVGGAKTVHVHLAHQPAVVV